MFSNNLVLSLDDVKKKILKFCLEPHGPTDILEHIKVRVSKSNYIRFVTNLLDKGLITSVFLRKRTNANHKCITTRKGINYLKDIA